MSATGTKDRGRRLVKASVKAHHHLKMIAAMDGITVEKAHDKYAAPLLEAVFKRLLAKATGAQQ